MLRHSRGIFFLTSALLCIQAICTCLTEWSDLSISRGRQISIYWQGRQRGYTVFTQDTIIQYLPPRKEIVRLCIINLIVYIGINVQCCAISGQEQSTGVQDQRKKQRIRFRAWIKYGSISSAGCKELFACANSFTWTDSRSGFIRNIPPKQDLCPELDMMFVLLNSNPMHSHLVVYCS